MRKLKIGLDIHGVIDSKPEFFEIFSKTLVDAGHEVHILTGPHISDKLKEYLKKLNISYTHLFSISDYHKEKGTEIHYDDKGDPHLDRWAWDSAKAEYAQQHELDLHFDDSDQYKYWFTTPYCRYYSMDTDRIKKIRIGSK